MKSFTIINIIILITCFIASVLHKPEALLIVAGTFSYIYIVPVLIIVNIILSINGIKTKDSRFGDALTLGSSLSMLIFWGLSRAFSDAISNTIYYLF